MNLDYLRTYLEVIRLGSFSEVAKKLSISQPAVSFQIQKLEQDLGVRLVDRSQKVITMTQAGKRVLHFAEFVEEERNHLQRDLDQMREEVTGSLVVAASTIPGEFLLPPILSEFKSLHPTVKAQVVVSDSLTVIQEVRNSNYEIGFCGAAPERHELESFKIAEDEIVLIVFPEHPFAERDEVDLKELEGEPFIFREETSGTQQSLKALLSGAGFNLNKWAPNLVVGTTQAVVSTVELKTGVAFVSSLAIKNSLALGLVKKVAVKGLSLKRNFYCVYRRERVVSRLLEEFIAFVRVRAPLD
ncbi:MAG: selenium metabolism-associated LysR family transcriptional regulator [Dehalococcoidia bacterium]